MSLNTNVFRRALARGSSLLRIKLRKPLNTKDEGVSPGCTRLLRKNTCRHTQTHTKVSFTVLTLFSDSTSALASSVVDKGVKLQKTVLIVCLCMNKGYPFPGEAVWSWSVGVGKQLRQTGFSLLLHPVAVGHSEQVHPVAI